MPKTAKGKKLNALFALAQAPETPQSGPACKALLAQGIDPALQDRNGMSALMWAALEGNASLCAALAPATPASLRCAQGRTALMHAVSSPKALAALLPFSDPELAEPEAGYRALELAIAAGCQESALALAKASRLDYKTPAGIGPLAVAARSGCPNVLRKLLSAGCSPADLDSFGRTPLRCAVDAAKNSERACACAKILIPLTDLTAQALDGKTPEQACESKSLRKLIASAARAQAESKALALAAVQGLPKPGKSL